MPSILNNLMRDAAPAISEALGDRDEQGDFAEIDYTRPSGGEPIKLVGWSVGRITTRPEITAEIGQVETVELLAITGPRYQLENHKIKSVQLKAIVTVDGEKWQIDPETSGWGNVFVTLGLRREPLHNFHEGRHAQV